MRKKLIALGIVLAVFAAIAVGLILVPDKTVPDPSDAAFFYDESLGLAAMVVAEPVPAKQFFRVGAHQAHYYMESYWRVIDPLNSTWLAPGDEIVFMDWLGDMDSLHPATEEDFPPALYTYNQQAVLKVNGCNRYRDALLVNNDGTLSVPGGKAEPSFATMYDLRQKIYDRTYHANPTTRDALIRAFGRCYKYENAIEGAMPQEANMVGIMYPADSSDDLNSNMPEYDAFWQGHPITEFQIWTMPDCTILRDSNGTFPEHILVHLPGDKWYTVWVYSAGLTSHDQLRNG